MSAPDLPENPRDWPTDPFDLLGVPRGASETDIKRAYTRLIRRFKPEHAPEPFRRVREAYETCLRQFRWFQPPPGEVVAFPTPPVPPPRTADPPPDRPAAATPGPPPGSEPADRPAPLDRPQAADDAGRLWERAIAGDLAAAYAGLVGLAADRRDRADLPLRLYWLLGLDPALDPVRTRHHWLADGLRRSRLGGAAAELYRRELDANPDAALSWPYHDVLAPDAASRDLLTLARWRLVAAVQSGAWAPAEADLQALAGAVPAHNESGWLAHLVTAVDWSAWERPNPVYTRARAELDRLQHLELSHGYAFDRIEETEHLTAGWGGFLAGFAARGLFGLLPAAWAGALSPGRVAAVVAEVASDPGRHLLRLDRVVRDRGPGLLFFLLRAIEDHRRAHGPPDEPEFPPDLIRGLARHLPGGFRRAYPHLRDDLLTFLLAEAIHPLELAAACDHHPDAKIRQICPLVREDPGLALVWAACRLHAG